MEAQFTLAETTEIASYSLGISMDRWAHACWRMFNGLVFRGPPGMRKPMADLLGAASTILPCGLCQHHMQEYIRSAPPPGGDHQTDEDMQRWVVDFHNSVSRRTDKAPMAFEDVRDEALAFAPDAYVADWWSFLLAVATLYRPEQRDAVAGFINASAHILPAGLAWRDSPLPPLDSADSLLSNLAQRPDCPYGGRFNVLAEFVPPQMLGTSFEAKEEEKVELERLFAVRVRGRKEARKRAFDRIAGMTPATLDKYIAPLRIGDLDTTTYGTGTGAAGKGLTGPQIAGIVVAIVAFIALVGLVVWLFIRQKPAVTGVQSRGVAGSS